ncbi:MAG: serpin family protein, partial [Chthoniobacterales bacterium]
MLRAFLLNALFVGTIFAADDWSLSGYAVNGFAVDLLHKNSTAENEVFSPFSIQLALGMALAGAQGETQKQMRTVLHDNREFAGGAFAALNQKSLDAMTNPAASSGKYGGDLITLTVANRIYGQTGFQFRPEYLQLLREKYGAPLEDLNFGANPAAAAHKINAWVEKQTRNRIRNLVDPGLLSDLTRLVLVNAIYLKAPWQDPFEKNSTKPGPFRIASGELVRVPMMSREA